MRTMDFRARNNASTIDSPQSLGLTQRSLRPQRMRERTCAVMDCGLWTSRMNDTFFVHRERNAQRKPNLADLLGYLKISTQRDAALDWRIF